ncbi:DUF192 domain-containing protein [Mameliella alba]|uniref:DUF192 domain-containing protein n=1 Tax=Mameliella alba TaxID=561184 RepID=A0A0B3SBU4_9RHOB|nr:DUF192 domain-containing protein [Mameliella alba]KHQ54166.1 hypothetical protein OA50_01396 [Mameliella alba]
MGKRLVALSLVATLVAWPVWSQDEGSVILEQETAPPPPAAQAPVAAAPDSAPVEGGPTPADPVAEVPVPDPGPDAPEESEPVARVTPDPADPAEEAREPEPAQEPSDEKPPLINPILPIGDEPLADAAPEPTKVSDPDNRVGECREDTLYVRGGHALARFNVDVADTPDSRAQGLMNVKSMPASKGMLFIYPAPQPVAFWMKNTFIPLDIIFADSQGVVVHVHANAKPHDETSIPGGEQVQFVLEINGGYARMLGIKEGAQMRHPAIRRAAWPC